MPPSPAPSPELLPSVYQGSARSLLLTILGEFVLPDRTPVWTSTLLEVMTSLGVESRSARQALARGASSGWIVGERHGREVRWQLTDAGAELITEWERRTYAFSRSQPWDGTWLVVSLTISQSQRAVRKKMYAALARRGFGNPTAGVWLTPHVDRRVGLGEQIAKYGLLDSTLTFVGRSADIGLSDAEITAKSWDLSEASGRYRLLLRRFPSKQGPPSGSAVQDVVRLLNGWQHMPLVDPYLPEELLPGWVGREATERFTELRTRWRPAATREWAQIAEGARR